MMPHHAKPAPHWGSQSRDAAFAFLELDSTEIDVLVVGGGITGAGIALDAATRGLTTAVFEASDWGEGTSSRSSKLVHGGIRYLEQLNFSLVREALAERNLLLHHIAPHLVQPVSFLYPIRRPLIERLYVGAGMLLYDLFASSHRSTPSMPWHRHLSAKRLSRTAPSIRKGVFRGALKYYDAQVDDARLVITVVRTAVHYGATAVNRLRVDGYLREGKRVIGVTATDQLTGRVIVVRAKQVITATGVWTHETDALLGTPTRLQVNASQGVHLVVPRHKILSQSGMLMRTPSSVLFVIPWGEFWLIGTTDTPWNGDVSQPQATTRDIDYLLEQVNSMLGSPLKRSDIVSVYAGLRPLVTPEVNDTSRVSREHRIVQPVPGLTLIAGGKLTTYRVMARDAVDASLKSLNRNPLDNPSVTDKIPLLGAEGLSAVENRAAILADAYGLSLPQVQRLIRRYGSLANEVLSLIDHDPNLAEPLQGFQELLSAEVAYAVQYEGALSLSDVLERRTRVRLEQADNGRPTAEHAAALMAPLFGWSAAHTQTEIESYIDAVNAQRTHSGL